MDDAQYLDMILKAWGDWQLFQTLLSVLRSIGDRHGGVSIANVATRWVLDHQFVGAVLVGESIPHFPFRLPYFFGIRASSDFLIPDILHSFCSIDAHMVFSDFPNLILFRIQIGFVGSYR